MRAEGALNPLLEMALSTARDGTKDTSSGSCSTDSSPRLIWSTKVTKSSSSVDKVAAWSSSEILKGTYQHPPVYLMRKLRDKVRTVLSFENI